jgi:hypothetical protein
VIAGGFKVLSAVEVTIGHYRAPTRIAGRIRTPERDLDGSRKRVPAVPAWLPRLPRLARGLWYGRRVYPRSSIALAFALRWLGLRVPGVGRSGLGFSA